MEVHHHSHTPDPDPSTSSGHRGRKKWTHYFREFLMLFLAVFCGFLAEYQLEHKIEKDRGKQFIISYREDLCMDTAILNNRITALKRIIAAGDSISKMIAQHRFYTREDIKKLYDFNIGALAGYSVVLTDRTSTQLKNSGGMRLIAKKNVAQAIINYWSGIRNVETIDGIFNTMRMQARERSYWIFDQKYYSDSSVNGKRTIADDAALMTKDLIQLTEFSNRVAHIKNLLKGTFTTVLKEHLSNAVSLIQLLDKEYRLK